MYESILSVALTALQQVIIFTGTYLRSLLIKNEAVCQCENRVRGKVAIVTGATNGIGYYTALDLARKGSRLYIACRSQVRGKKTVDRLRKVTDNKEIHCLYLDLTKLSTIHEFAKQFYERETRLDLLVNNAGVFHQPSCLTEDGIEITYQTNFLGVFLLTSLLEEILKKSSSARVVFVSSEAHRLVKLEELLNFDHSKAAVINSFNDFVNVYGISKLALHLYADQLTKRLPGTEIVLVNPGNVWTNIYRNCWTSWGDLLTRIRCAYYMKLPVEGAQSSIHAMNSPANNNSLYIQDNFETETMTKFEEEISNAFFATSKKILHQ